MKLHLIMGEFHVFPLISYIITPNKVGISRIPPHNNNALPLLSTGKFDVVKNYTNGFALTFCILLSTNQNVCLPKLKEKYTQYLKLLEQYIHMKCN